MKSYEDQLSQNVSRLTDKSMKMMRRRETCKSKFKNPD